MSRVTLPASVAAAAHRAKQPLATPRAALNGAGIWLCGWSKDDGATLAGRLAQLGFAVEVIDPGVSMDAAKALPLLAVIHESRELPPDAPVFQALLRQQTTVLICGACDPAAVGLNAEWLPAEIPVAEVVGRVCALARLTPRLQHLEQEVAQLQRVSQQLNRYFAEIDQEMRLAGRLQRDFLPRHNLEMPGLALGALYRPASWVSGDLYDLFRIDDEHIGIFVADAMGHGVAAGLITMFLRQSLVTRRDSPLAEQILEPAAVLNSLHESLSRQRLPNCQFVTAAYAVINVRTLQCRITRAGHPCPLLIRASGAAPTIVEPAIGGGLLGIPELPPEPTETLETLEPGDKLVFFTDGIEDVLIETRQEKNEPRAYSPELLTWAAQPAGEFVESVTNHLDRQAGSLHPADDITLVVAEVSHFRPSR